MIFLGQRISWLKPVAALGSKKGSSIASFVLSKVIPYKSQALKQITKKVLTKVVGRQIAKKTATKVVGRLLGRLVPGVGWVLLAVDIWENREYLMQVKMKIC